MNPRDLALALIEGAALLFPPLARVIARALDTAPDVDDPDLADEVRRRLPVDGESARAARDLEKTR